MFFSSGMTVGMIKHTLEKSLQSGIIGQLIINSVLVIDFLFCIVLLFFALLSVFFFFKRVRSYVGRNGGGPGRNW